MIIGHFPRVTIGCSGIGRFRDEIRSPLSTASQVSACFLSSAMWAGTPAERLSQQVAQAKALADRHAYREAAAVLEKLASDIDITTLPNWSGHALCPCTVRSTRGKSRQGDDDPEVRRRFGSSASW